jgi:hypothetical protein
MTRRAVLPPDEDRSRRPSNCARSRAPTVRPAEAPVPGLNALPTKDPVPKRISLRGIPRGTEHYEGESSNEIQIQI